MIFFSLISLKKIAISGHLLSKASVPARASTKSGSTTFNHATASGVKTQIPFNTTTATALFKIHSFPKGLYKASV